MYYVQIIVLKDLKIVMPLLLFSIAFSLIPEEVLTINIIIAFHGTVQICISIGNCAA